jgi:hypothetical protein
MAYTGTNAPVARHRKSDNAYNENIRETLGIIDISRKITNFVTRRGSYVLKVRLKRNVDLVKTVKAIEFQREMTRIDLILVKGIIA